MEIADGTNEHTQAIRGAIVTGDVSTMPLLDTLDVWDLTTFYGEIPVSMKVLWIGGLNSCTISNLALMVNLVTGIIYATNTVTVEGSIAGLTKLVTWQMFKASSESGSIAGLTNLAIFFTYSQNITVPNVTNLTKLSSFFTPGIVLLAANVNQILADVWTNRNVAKPSVSRSINLQAATGSDAPTGQGLIDKAALQAYRTPNDDPAYALWTINTL